ncbi:MAG: hypothetical protein GX770_08120 [Firmicutes bacterium]|nr:hypothetical protein [Bacillota bacterium]
MDRMQNTFTTIRPQNFQDFFQNFPGAARQDLCHGCDGSSATGGGFFTPVCLLPGELEFLQETNLHLEPGLEPILTPHGTIYCLSPIALCPYRRSNHYSLEKGIARKPVECTIYPLTFNRHGSDELDVSPNCRRQAAFRKDDFIIKTKVAMAVYLLPYLEETWLRHRNEMNILLDPDCYHQLKNKKAGQPITLKEFKACAAEGCS